MVKGENIYKTLRELEMVSGYYQMNLLDWYQLKGENYCSLYLIILKIQ